MVLKNILEINVVIWRIIVVDTESNSMNTKYI